MQLKAFGLTRFIKTICFFVLASALVSTPVVAGSPREFEKLSLLVPPGWKKVHEFYGVPLMILGPLSGAARPTVTFSFTERDNFNFDPVQLKRNENQYRVGREAWLAKHRGRSLAYFPYTFTSVSRNQERHVLGFRFVIDDVEFVEKSYYHVCPEKIYLAKTLLRAEHEKEFTSVVEAVATSLRCRN